jgi:predicted TIM-barrel fold metal-dependent hydrolase
MNYFDANTWVGRWPFSFQPAHTPRSLATHLRSLGIRRALVSPLDAVLASSPGPANCELLRGTRGISTLEPVPVINPALADWREELAVGAADPRVRAVRVLPNYHHYRLRSRAMREFAEELQRRRLRLIVQVRLIDERHEFHAMHLKGVPVADIDQFLAEHPKVRLLVCGLGRAELFALAPKHPRLRADLSFVEWHDVLPNALTKVSRAQLVFGSHTPFLITAASQAKLDGSGLSAWVMAPIAAGNLARFLGD